MKKKAVELVGWYGVAAILLGYALVSFEIVAAKSYTYQLLNLSGAVGIIIVSLAKKAPQPAVLNVVWAAVALVVLLGLIRQSW